MKRVLRRWRWILAGMGLLLLGGVGTLWLLFQHIPGWYRPARISLADLQRVRDDMVATSDAVSVQLNSARAPFKVVFTQDQLNAWLAARESIEPLSRNWLPASVQEPMVVLEKGAMRVGATYSGNGISTVVSARLALSADGEGIWMRLEEVSGGSLGLPDWLVREALEAAGGHVSGAGSDTGFFRLDKSGPEPKGLLEGLVIPNTARLRAGGHRFRIIDISIEPGALTVTIERLPEDHSSR